MTKAIGVVPLFLIAACARNEPAPAEKPSPAPTPTVEVVRIVEQPVNVTLSMPGELQAFQSVAVYPRITGFVKMISVDRGTRVRAGQVLAVLEAPELVAQRAEAQSKLQAAEAQLAAARSKADANVSTYQNLKAASATPGVVAGNDLVVAQKAVEADQNQVAAAQQTAEAARQAVRSLTEMEGYLKVTAPFDGVVTERNVHPGALVGPSSGAGASTPMLTLIENARLRLVIPVPQAYTAEIANGSTMKFTVPAYPGETFSGTVARIAHAVDVKTRTMAVELDVPNRDGRLAPGTYCQVPWPVHRPAPSLFVPAGSVASTTDRTFVVRVRDGRTEWIDVKTGLASGPNVEVFGDLKPGEEVATRGTDEIRPGTQVQVKEVKPTAS
jgi:RND family efflux transporter MFP subunit